MKTKFESGKTYEMHITNSHEIFPPVKVLSRTDKRIKIQIGLEKPVSKKIEIYDDFECCYVTEKYCYAPIITSYRLSI